MDGLTDLLKIRRSLLIGLSTFFVTAQCFSQVLELSQDYIDELNTDTNGTVVVARNFESYLAGPLTGSGTLTLKGGFATTTSSMLTLITIL